MEIQNMWLDSQKSYELSSFNDNYDTSSYLKKILECFEDIAWENARLNYLSRVNMHSTYGWFLSKYHINFLSSFNYSDEFKFDIKTWPYFAGNFACGRRFVLKDHLGSSLIEADSIWSLVEYSTGKIVKPYNILGINLDGKTEVACKSECKRINVDIDDVLFTDDNLSLKQESWIYIDDPGYIDQNNHVNNSNYILFLLNPIKQEFLANYTLKTIDIHFKKPIFFKSSIKSVFKYNHETSSAIHILLNPETNNVYCVAISEWDNKLSKI